MAVQVYDTVTSAYIALATYIAALSDTDKDTAVTIRFMYRIDQILDEAKKITSLRTRTVGDKEQANIIELTEDEATLFTEQLEEIAGEIAKKLLAWSKGMNQAYQFNASFDYEGTVGVKAVVKYEIQIAETSYFDIISTVERQIESALVAGGISQWFLINRLEDYTLEYGKFQKLLYAIRDSLYSVKQVDITKGFFDHEEDPTKSTE